MTEIIENKRKEIKVEIEIDKGEIKNLLMGIDRCTERLGRLIELRGPMSVISREVAMIQYRALSVLSLYEALALLNFVYKEDDPEPKEKENGTIR